MMSSPFSTRTARGWAAALAACSRSDGSNGDSDTPPDPLQVYRTQAVQWAECHSTILDAPMDRFFATLPTGRLGANPRAATFRWR